MKTITTTKTKKPYFNMHGGGPGTSPAMTKPLELDEKPFMGGLNDRDALYRVKIAKDGDAA